MLPSLKPLKHFFSFCCLMSWSLARSSSYCPLSASLLTRSESMSLIYNLSLLAKTQPWQKQLWYVKSWRQTTVYQYVPTHWLPELCAKNAFFGHFGDFQPQGWIWAKVALRFMTFFLGHAQIINIWRSGWESDLHLKDFNFFFRLSFYLFSYLFAAVIGLLLSLLPVPKFLREHCYHRQILPWSS